MVKCPQCDSNRVWKSGLRYSKTDAEVQRWLCRDCGFRFSKSFADPDEKVNITYQFTEKSNSAESSLQSHILQRELTAKPLLKDSSFKVRENVGSHSLSVQSSVEKSIYAFLDYNRERRVCDSARSKNLDTATTRTETVSATSTVFDSKTAKGLLLQYALYLQKEGYGVDCRYKSCIRMLINSGANLLDPENVKEVIAKKPWKDGTKMQVSYAYDAMARMLKLTWTMAKYRQEEAFPFIPEEKELDALIAGAGSQRMSSYLQTLKETLTDPSEALRIKWIDIKGNVITINRPCKGHYPRQVEVSNTLISTLNALPKTSELIFPTTYRSLASCYFKVRRKLARKLNNPRLLSISLVTFRHWGATMLYHHTRDILLVKKMLGHKNIQNTMKYTQLVNFKDDDYEVTTATTEDEIKALGKAGFMKYDEHNGIHFYRKPKRFVSLA